LRVEKRHLKFVKERRMGGLIKMKGFVLRAGLEKARLVGTRLLLERK